MPIPDWVLGAFPKVAVPTLVVWGMRDKALLPLQLDGLDALVDDLRIVRVARRRPFRRRGRSPSRSPRRSGTSLPSDARGYSAAPMTNAARSRSRSAARLAAVQALYQQEMEGTPLARLLHEFHHHRLGATIEDANMPTPRSTSSTIS